jgi:nucleoside-diphosphate-sugar epimerase
LNDRIRREGTSNLLSACRELGVERYVQQSIAHLVADGSSNLLNESAPIRTSSTSASAADMEEMVTNSGLRWAILRGGAFYGPGTGRDEAWRNSARDGRLRLPADGAGYISLAHITDVADAVVLATEIAPVGVLLTIVDDQPVTYAELFGYLAHLEGGPDPQPGGPPTPWLSFRVSNARAHDVPAGGRACGHTAQVSPEANGADSAQRASFCSFDSRTGVLRCGGCEGVWSDGSK